MGPPGGVRQVAFLFLVKPGLKKIGCRHTKHLHPFISKPKALYQNPINSKGSASSFCWRQSADVGLATTAYNLQKLASTDVLRCTCQNGSSLNGAMLRRTFRGHAQPKGYQQSMKRMLVDLHEYGFG